MTYFCMPWSMSGNLKIQNLEIIIFENLCQSLKVRYFRYFICVKQNENISGCFQCFFLRVGQTFGYYVLVTKVYVICVWLRTQPKSFEKLKYIKKKFVYGKKLVIQFPLWKNTSHSSFKQLSVLLELHEKCMISIFLFMKIVWLAFWSTRGTS